MIKVKQKKIGNSFYGLIPKEIRGKKLYFISEEEIHRFNNENKEEDFSDDFVKQVIFKLNNTNEEVLNRLDYLENKIVVEDTYRKEKVDLQEFYNDYLWMRNTFFKFKKEMGK